MHIFSDTLLLLIILERRKPVQKEKDIQQTHTLTEWKYIEKKRS